jgi:hypothetical protein
MRFRCVILDLVILAMKVVICFHIRQYPLWIYVESEWYTLPMWIVASRREVTGGEINAVECLECVEC